MCFFGLEKISHLDTMGAHLNKNGLFREAPRRAIKTGSKIKVNREEFERRAAFNTEIVKIVMSKFVRSKQQVTFMTGAASKTLYRVLDRKGGTDAEFKSSGPTATRMSGAELAKWLNENMPHRTYSDAANLLREIADSIERKQPRK